MDIPKEFAIQLEEPWKWQGLEPPSDPLGELSELEMGLRLFCFECNRKVLLKIGNDKKDVFLDPDIVLILDELPEEISKLSLGKKIEMDFPESYLIVELVPDADTIDCSLRNFGYSTERKQFQLDKTQVVEALKGFVEEIVGKAVAGGYIKLEDKDRFLMPMRREAMR